MKRIKPGFTLAEVLITLGIIGVVAAIVMPSVMSNYTYKTVGVKLSKFASQLEAATRPFVVQNTSFGQQSNLDVSSFIEESFLIKNLGNAAFDPVDQDCDAEATRRANPITCSAGGQVPVRPFATENEPAFVGGDSEGSNFPLNSTPIELKDGTRFMAYSQDHEDQDDINTAQVGEIAWGIAFAPEVQGLPRAVNKIYRFVVTELGYVYPDRTNDACISNIFDNEFATTSRDFREGSVCVDGFQGAEEDDDD